MTALLISPMFARIMHILSLSEQLRNIAISITRDIVDYNIAVYIIM